MNYNDIYKNFISSSVKCTESPENPFFLPTKDADKEIITNPYAICLQNASVWDDEDLDELKELKVPSQVIAFYRHMNPNHVPINNAGVQLLSLKKMKDEYTQLEPGAYLIKFGFLTIGTTFGGNPMIVDLNVPNAPVYITESNIFFPTRVNGKISLEFSFCSKKLYEKYHGSSMPITYDTIKDNLMEVEGSFNSFIAKLSLNQYGTTQKDLEALLDDLLD